MGNEPAQIKGKAKPKPRRMTLGRPRREVDAELIKELPSNGYGYKRIAGEYTKVTGEYISHTAVRERLVGDSHSVRRVCIVVDQFRNQMEGNSNLYGRNNIREARQYRSHHY